MKRRALKFAVCAIAVLWGITGCHSTKPPPPRPQAVTTADRIGSQAEKFSQDGQWAAAAKEWKQAAEQYELLNNQPQVAMAWHNVGEAEEQLSNFSESRRWLEQAARLNEKLGRNEDWWRDQIVLMQVEAQSRDTNAWQKRMDSLKNRSGELKDPYLKGLFLNEVGLWEQSRGEMGQAATAFKEAVQQFTAAHNETGLAAVQANQARLLEAEKNWTAAVQAWQEALQKFQALAQPPGITAALAGLGRSYLGATNYAAAEDYLRRAARNYRTLNKGPELASTVDLLAQALAAQGKEAEAKEVRTEMGLPPSSR